MVSPKTNHSAVDAHSQFGPHDLAVDRNDEARPADPRSMPLFPAGGSITCTGALVLHFPPVGRIYNTALPIATDGAPLQFQLYGHHVLPHLYPPYLAPSFPSLTYQRAAHHVVKS